MRTTWVLGAVLTAALPAASRAQVQLGVRAGWAASTGDVFRTKGSDVTPSETVRMSNWIGTQIPLQLDVGYGVTAGVTVGAYVSYGYGLAGGGFANDCRTFHADCSASVVRTGLEASYAFPFTRSAPRLAGWVGLGAGYEWAESDAKVYALTDRTSLEGWELLNVQAGADYRVSDRFAVGPYVMYGLGRYSGGSSSGTAFSALASTRMHGWLGLGVRGTYRL